MAAGGDWLAADQLSSYIATSSLRIGTRKDLDEDNNCIPLAIIIVDQDYLYI